VLEEVGEGADTDLAVGEHVMAIVLPLGPRGAYAEHVVVPVESVVRAPAGASDVEAATLPMNGLTARAALDALALERGQVLAVTGAAGAVGGYAVQLGKADGLEVVADAAPADEALVRALGAGTVLRRGTAFAAQVRERWPDGVDALIDTALMDGDAARLRREWARRSGRPLCPDLCPEARTGARGVGPLAGSSREGRAHAEGGGHIRGRRRTRGAPAPRGGRCARPPGPHVLSLTTRASRRPNGPPRPRRRRDGGARGTPRSDRCAPGAPGCGHRP
jgi:hypothetical protein